MSDSKNIKCSYCEGTGKSSLGPVKNMNTGVTTHDDCHICDGNGDRVDIEEFKKAGLWRFKE